MEIFKPSFSPVFDFFADHCLAGLVVSRGAGEGAAGGGGGRKAGELSRQDRPPPLRLRAP
eukprot:1800620-Pyramimonas_sp.AAC.2